MIYYVVLAILLVSYRQYHYDHAVHEKEAEMAFAIQREIDKIDYSTGQAISVISELGEAYSLYALRYNRNQITTLLKRAVNDTDITHAVVCDLEGNGYDHNGKEVQIGKEPYFAMATEEYSRGGIGLVIPKSEEGGVPEVYLVDGISFERKDRGYIIASLPVVSVADQIFTQRFEADKIAIVSMDGQVLSISSWDDEMKEGDDFWSTLPRGVSKDSIKLSLSQKNIYYAEAPGYGYYIVVPLDTFNGGAIALVDYEDMKSMANISMVPFKLMAIGILISSVALIALILLSYFISDIILKMSREKKYSQVERDVLTGLLTPRSAARAIDEYISQGSGKRGMLFVIALNFDEFKAANKDYEVDPGRIKDFASVLANSFRSTDIIGRTEDNEFLVFLKDIGEEKDVRRQTDHMQMFLHDARASEGGKEITANAGASLCPDNGKNAADILEAARTALDRAIDEGPGRLSF